MSPPASEGQQPAATMDTGNVFVDNVFVENNKHIAKEWMRIGDLYPEGKTKPLLPEEFSFDDFGQGIHYECFMISALAALMRVPDVIRHCFVTKEVQPNGRYVFQFFRDKSWVEVEIDDTIALEDGEVLYIRSPTERWWPLLLEKAYAKFYTAYDHLEGCTLQETFHDLTGNPVLNIPTDHKLAKAAGVPVTTGPYWLDLAQKLQTGAVVASGLTKTYDLSKIGMEKQQQYGIRSIFSLNGSSTVKDIVVQLHNPFEDEEYIYQGPLNPKDAAWTPRRRAKYNVDDQRSIFLPLNVFLKIFSTVQVCVILPSNSEVLFFDDEWKGETAGGNPTRASWRKNPLFLVRNTSHKDVSYLVALKQRDQRESAPAEDPTHYLSCGLVLTRYTYAAPMPTKFVAGNNHQSVYRSLFCDVREVASLITVPADSLCYLVPCCMEPEKESPFTLAWYPMPEMDTSGISIEKLSLPEQNWEQPQTAEVELNQKEKRRVDFYVDCPSQVHILLRQLKPFVSKTGGDAMAQDYMGVHLYDDTDRRIGGVHAATNFREVSVIQQLPRSGRYAISVTCSRATSAVAAEVVIVTDKCACGRIVDAPEDAEELCGVDEDAIDEGEEAQPEEIVISDEPVVVGEGIIEESPDSATPYEDKRFYTENRVTTGPWVHIGDLYPEGKSLPLLPEKLSRSQFAPGTRRECSVLSAFAALVDHHDDVIRRCFVSKHVRRDGGYTFQFYRYGEWVKVEVDDRIPMDGNETVFCNSPTHHWWPLLLEKAYAKFYTLYQNLEGILFSEVFHDFTGLPVMDISTDVEIAVEQGFNFDDVSVWREIKDRLGKSVFAVTSKSEGAAMEGFADDRSYPIVDIEIEDNKTAKVVLYDVADSDMRTVSMDSLLRGFAVFHEGLQHGLVTPATHFFNQWGEGTNGGDPSLVTWRKNPKYLVRNPSDRPIDVVGLVQLRDQRHRLHRQTNQQLNYVENLLVLAVEASKDRIPTFLVTGNNHPQYFHENVLNSRETASRLTVPANSLCYLVPSALYRDRFLFSLWTSKEADRDVLQVSRLHVDAAEQAPGIQHFELAREDVGRVDFLVDVETDVHILLTQKKAFKCTGGGDAIAEDYFTMELYNDKDERIAHTGEATNYREIGLVHHLLKPGRYALAVACLPLVSGVAPCEVRIYGSEAAHVRVTDTPDEARELGVVDLSFLDPEPEGVPLSHLPLSTDGPFQDSLDQYKRYNRFAAKYGTELVALEEKMNDRAHELARAHDPNSIQAVEEEKEKEAEELEATEQEKEEEAETLEAVEQEKEAEGLEATEQEQEKEPEVLETVEQEKAEEELEATEQEKEKEAETLEAVEQEKEAEGLEATEEGEAKPENALEATEEGNSRSPSENLSILSDSYDGIPTSHLNLMEDEEFQRLRQERSELLNDPVQNARAINVLEEAMQERARAIARQMHAEERAFLNPYPEGIPLELVPLDDDEIFTSLEADRRVERRRKHPNEEKVGECEVDLESRSEQLARQLKSSERELFLDPLPLRVPLSDLPLDSDEEFHSKEVERLYKRKEDPQANAEVITVLEKEMMQRVMELAAKNLEELRSFLDPEPEGIPLDHLGMDHNPECNALEDELRELKRDPEANAEQISVVQNKIRDLVQHIASSMACMDRDFLDPEPEGRLLNTLPLDDNEEFAALDKEQRRLRYLGQDSARQDNCEKRMNEIAHEIAHGVNVADRPSYLAPKYKGVPVEELNIDEDPTFTALEVDRAVLLQDPIRNDRVIAETNTALVNRVLDLADSRVASDRDYLNKEPDTLPLRFLPLARDGEFSELEAKRMDAKTSDPVDAEAVAAVEQELNQRAVVLAQQVRAQERQTYIRPKYMYVSFQDLPLTTDESFRALEVERMVRKEQNEPVVELEEKLHERATELAKELLHRERCEFLDPEPLGVPLEELVLDDDAFLAKQEELREKKRDGTSSASQSEIEKLEEELNEMTRTFASLELKQLRGFLDPEPLEEDKLNEDPKFRELEKEYRQLKKDPNTAECERTTELEGTMNERNIEISKDIMRNERPDYLAPTHHSVPNEQLPLDTDEAFQAMEWDRARKVRTPEIDPSLVELVESKLNERADELAAQKLAAARGFLNPEPEGVPLKYLPLDTDDQFKTLEEERLQAVNASEPEKVSSLEEALNERAAELARELKKTELTLLDPAPHDVPVEQLHLHDDEVFASHLPVLREALQQHDEPVVEDTLKPMNARAAEVALQRLHEDRPIYLEGGEVIGYIPVKDIRLDEDATFHRREVARVIAKNEGNEEDIARLNEKLHNRAVELSEVQVMKDYNYLEPNPLGVPVSVVRPHKDETFFNLVNAHRTARRLPSDEEGAQEVKELQPKMDERVKELAAELLGNYRSFLHSEYEGVPLSAIPIDSDERFKSLEAERAIALNIPEMEVVLAMEDRLHHRARELAVRMINRQLSGVDGHPRGVPLHVLEPQHDETFKDLLLKRLALRSSEEVDPEADQGLVDSMNARALELANTALERDYLPAVVEDYPVEDLPLEQDEVFHPMEVERVVLKARQKKQLEEPVEDPEKEEVYQQDTTPVAPEEEDLSNVVVTDEQIQKMEEDLNARAVELAKARLHEDLAGCDQEPLGIPIELLHPMRDEEVKENVMKRRELLAANDEEGVAAVDKVLNDRVHQLAREEIERERAFLPEAPENVPLKYLPLDTDDEFAPLMLKRIILKLTDAEENAPVIEEVENQLQDRASEIAREKKEAELALFKEEYEGVETKALNPHDDPEFHRSINHLREIESDPSSSDADKEPVLSALEKRLLELAREAKDGDLWFVDPAPRGIPREDLPLKSDPIFQEMYVKRAELKEEEGHQDEIDRLQHDMNERAYCIADNILDGDFRGVETNPRGLPRDLLAPRDDGVVAELLVRRHKPHSEEEDEEIVAALNQRVDEMAKQAITGQRAEYLDARPKGIPIADIAKLDTDPIFNGLEVERAKLVLSDPETHAKQISDMDARLKERSETLADEVVESDLCPLYQEPESVPIRLLHPHQDETFSDLASVARTLREMGEEQEPALREEETKLNARAVEIAYQRMRDDRDYLDEFPEGVPLDQLPLDTDTEFHTLEKRRLAIKLAGSENCAVEQLKLEQHLNYRAHELAMARLREDFEGLNQNPHGVPLEVLQPHGKFSTLVPQLRKLKSDEKKDRLEGVQHQLDEILNDMAADFLAKDRASYLDATPDEVPLCLVPLDNDAAFKALEAQRFELLREQEPHKNRDAIRNLEDDLNAQAVVTAKQYREESRLDFLPPSTQGIPLRALHLSEDRPFRDLENKRFGHMARDPERNAAPIHLLEGRMRDRVFALSKDLAASDLDGIHDAEGIPLNLLCPHNDDQFLALVDTRRELQSAEERDEEAINNVVAKMNDRVGEIARQAISGDRSYLAPRPEGVPIAALPIDEDNLFHQLEVQRAIAVLSYENEEKQQVEERLNHRAAELAKVQVAIDLADLNPTARGVPTASVKPHLDETFGELADERRPQAKEEEPYVALTAQMNDRLNQYVEELATANRAAILPARICGVPQELLPLSSDETFREIEAEVIIVAKQNGEESQEEDAKKAMRERAEEVALDLLHKDRGYLGEEIEGIPVEQLPLDADSKFTNMEIQRAHHKYVDEMEDVDTEKVAAVEANLVERAHELAKQQYAKDLEGLEQYPRGIPLSTLQPHQDERFCSVLPELRTLKRNPTRNAPNILAVQAKLNKRTDQMAKAYVDAERAFLDREPEGVPLAVLPLDDDRQFTSMEKELRHLRANPEGREEEIAALQKKMNERAHELALEVLKNDRGYLHPNPAGVHIADVPIDDDEEFVAMEKERAKLKEDPEANKEAIQAMEDKLNARAKELALKMKEGERDFLRPTSSNIPIELLPLDDDTAFTNLEQQVRRLKHDPERNADALQELRNLLQRRADEIGEMTLKKDRPVCINAAPLAPFTILDLPLDEHERFTQAELERVLLLLRDSEANAAEAQTLGDEMNAIAQELARSQRTSERAFLDQEPEGIPLVDVPLDKDPQCRRMEEYLRLLHKDVDKKEDAIEETKTKLNNRSHELARMVKEEDIHALPEDTYHGVTKEDLNLHAFDDFREEANAYRACARNGDMDGACGHLEEMNRLAKKHAGEIVHAERTFLDQEPEGMMLEDVPLDQNADFLALEAERRRRLKDPLSKERNEGIVVELETKMNRLAHESAMEEFHKRREFMEPKPHGVPLASLPLDTDAPFREVEVACYRTKKNPESTDEDVEKAEAAMNERARELALQYIESDTSFLDQEPEGVPLEKVPLHQDEEFLSLAKERVSAKSSGTFEAIKELETSMNNRSHELAKAILEQNRAFLNKEPQNVPIEELNIQEDAIFHEKECGELLRARENPEENAELIIRLEAELNMRADELARELLEKERADQDQTPYGVPLGYLSLNYDEKLNPFERRRRALNKDPEASPEEKEDVEMNIAKRVEEIAKEYVDMERRTYLEAEPEGVPLEQLPLDEDEEFRRLEVQRREARLAANDDEVCEKEKELIERTHVLARRFKDDQERTRLAAEEEQARLAAEEEEERQRIAAQEVVEEQETLSAVENEAVKEEEALHADEAVEEKEEETLHADEAVEEKEEEALHADEAVEEKEEEALHADEAVEEKEEEALHADEAVEEKEEEVLHADEAVEEKEEEALHADEAVEEKEEEALHADEAVEEKEEEALHADEAVEEKEEEALHADEVVEEKERIKDRSYLNQNPRGIPLEDLDLDGDQTFVDLEEERYRQLDREENTEDQEVLLNKRVDELAQQYIKRERDEYIEEEPEGVSRDALPLDEDPEFHSMEIDRRNLKKEDNPDEDAIKALEERLLIRVSELAKMKKGWQDTEFHDKNAHVAPEWPRLRELYPEGVYEPATPDTTWPVDVMGPTPEAGFLAPFIAAVATHTALIKRILPDPAHPQYNPYVITLFDTAGHPVPIEVDDRVPCDAEKQPLYMAVPEHTTPRMWYPFLIEKAYAKYVGGYEAFVNTATPYDALHILTGRPVVHIPLQKKAGLSDCTVASYWRSLAMQLKRGDLFIAQTGMTTSHGLPTCACYTLLNIVDLRPESEETSSIGVCLYNPYVKGSSYTGTRINPTTAEWPEGHPKLGAYQQDGRVVVIPLSIFLENFVCLLRCVVNCGGRYNATGEWDDYTAGGPPKFTSFRKNPSYLLENQSGTTASVMVELEHLEQESGVYVSTGMALLCSNSLSRLPPTTLLTLTSHKVIQKAIAMDSKRLCAEFEIPPHSTCYLVPYRHDRAARGKFRVSLYPGIYAVTMTPVRTAGLTSSPLVKELELLPGESKGVRVDFSVGAACHVHLLVAQKQKGSSSSSDINASDEVSVAVYNEYGIKMASSGEASTLREQSIVFPAPQAGRYTVVPSCKVSASGAPCAVTVYLYTPRNVDLAEVTSLPDGAPLFTPLMETPRFSVPQRPLTGSSVRRDRSSRNRRHSASAQNQRPSSGSPSRGRR